MALRVTQGYQAPKVNLELEGLLVCPALRVQRELRECLDIKVRLVQEVPLGYLASQAPLGRQGSQGFLELKGTEELQVLLAQLA